MIAYAIWDQTSQISDRFLRQYLRDLFLEIALDFGDVAIDHDLERLIDRTHADHLVVFQSGHTSRSMRLKPAIEEFCQTDFLVAGHIIDRGYPSLHPQMVILNMAHYRALGRPMIGYVEHGETITLHRPERAIENVHDDYTPLWLRATGEMRTCTDRGFGWHLIHASLQAGLPVLNLPSSIRWAKRFLYPQDCPHRLAICLKDLAQDRPVTIPSEMAQNQRQYLHELLNPGAACATFLFNTEALHEAIDPTAARIFGPASGFKLFALWCQCASAEVVYYDHNPAALRLWQHIVTAWSGRDFPGFCRTHGYRGDFSKMAAVIAAAGGEEALERRWRGFQAAQPRFLLCDLLRDTGPLLDALAPAGNVVWYSNIFRYYEGIRRYGLQGCAERERKFQQELLARAPDTVWLAPKQPTKYRTK